MSRLRASTFLPLAAALIVMLSLFQNCSGVSFNTASSFASVKTYSNPDVAKVQPVLAVRNMACMHCHTTIQGNLVSDYRAGGASVDFLDQSTMVQGQGEYTQSSWSGYASRFFLSTSFVSGTILLPKVNLAPTTQTYLINGIAQSKLPMQTLKTSFGFGTSHFGQTVSIANPSDAVLMSTAPNSVQTAAEYLNTILNYRTPSYLNYIANWPDFEVKTVTPATTIREVKSVTIGAPNSAMLRQLLPANSKFAYFPTKFTSPLLTHFGLAANGAYFGNDAGQVMSCDGDLVVDGPVFLNNLILATDTGCRIYATGAIFVEGPQGTAQRQGIQYQGGSAPNLQLSSSKQISLGLGTCTLNQNTSAYGASSGGETARLNSDSSTFLGRVTHEQVSLGQPGGDSFLYVNTPKINDSLSDYNAIRDSNGQTLLHDASPNCANWMDPARKVAFDHLLLNAPRIDSRYTGGFNGVAITEFLLWARGEFHYSYDDVFNRVPVLPAIPAASFFQVNDCVVNGVDASQSRDTNYRSCN